MQYAEEITPQKKVVWHLDAPKGPRSTRSNRSDSTKSCDAKRLAPQAVDRQQESQGSRSRACFGRAESRWSRSRAHPVSSRPHHRRRDLLVSWLSLGKVVEYDKDFKEIWRYDIPTPWAAVRLHNGNTLITSEKLEPTREVNPQGETVWEFKLAELPQKIPFNNSQSCARLASGNTVLCSRGDHGKGCQLVEVTPEKKVVWVFNDWRTFGPATAVQVLDDPGIPEKPGDLQR